MQAAPQDAQKAHRGRWIALAGLWLVYAAFGATVASIAPLLPEIRAELDTSNATLGAIMGAWPLVYVAAAIPAGMLLDRIGVTAGLFIATLLIALSGALRAMSDTPLELLLAVAVFGLGGPIVSAGAPKLIAALFTGPQKGTAMGIYITGPSIGAIAALTTTNDLLLPLAGGWRGVMLIHAAVAVASGLAWLACSRLVGAEIAADRRQGFDPAAIAAMARNPQVAALLLLAVGIFYINHGMNNWLPAILRTGGMGAAQAGAWASVPTAAGLAAALIVPRFATAGRRLPLLALLFALSGGAAMAIAWGDGAVLAVGLVAMGMARGTMMTLTLLHLMELPTIPPERVGLASGMFFAAAEIGGVLGPVSFGVLRDLTGGFLAPLLSVTGMALLLLALVAGPTRAGRPPDR